ncbi:type II secretion system protein GspM [Bradyrhizobium guangxiense]|uniref:type II secretion system protein GspM n=1 Tax=Bradyrhizobium guangxiense TaxID=1325115 RepID=UPI0013E8CD48|nr:type II secretion system protein GspM [Bradyrhizobium guangxiense]
MMGWFGRQVRGRAFLAFNVVGLMLLALLFVGPVLSHFSTRNDEIQDSVAQLAYLQRITRGAQVMEQRGAQSAQPFMAGDEERVVSADLQARLQAMATARGAHVLGLRGLQGGRVAQSRTVAVGLQFEGSLGIVRDVIAEIEDQSPFLFITDASLRPASDGDATMLRAEFKVEGVMQDLRGKPPGMKEDQRAADLAGTRTRQ